MSRKEQLLFKPTHMPTHARANRGAIFWENFWPAKTGKTDRRKQKSRKQNRNRPAIISRNENRRQITLDKQTCANNCI